MQTETAARCSGVVKIYWSASGEVNALKGIDAEFPHRAVTAVVGPSGSGKSSLLRILSCMDRPTAGRVQIGGEEISALGPGRRRRVRRRLVGYVFQRPADNLVSYLTVREHLHLAARLRHRTRGWRREADELLQILGIADRARHLPHQLSGGEQQRVAFASAVMGRPALVVADEPTAELDSHAAETLLATVGSLAGRGTAFVIATHDPVAMRLAGRTYHLRHGALESETREARALSVIDQAGRIQLPARALKMFPDRRARISVDGDEVRITPP